MIKRLSLLLFLLTANLFAAAWTGLTSEPSTIAINDTTYYSITSPEELAWFANKVNGGDTTVNAVLANDIVFGNDTATINTGYSWTPIANTASHQFQGTLNGAGYTIYGLYTNNITYGGLVGVLGKSGVVKNVTMRKDSIRANTYAGSIAGYNYGKIDSCTNEGSVYAESSVYNAHVFSGGISGYNKGIVLKCLNRGIIFSNEHNSLSGYASSGGISGYNSGSIENCVNKGYISYSRSYSGGISGYNEGSISNCTNSDSVFSHTYSGGISGYNGGKITECINQGNLSSDGILVSIYASSCGGIVAYNIGSIINCMNSGNALLAYYSGGIIAYNTGSSVIVKNCYSVATSISANTAMGGTVGINKSSAQIINAYFDSTLISSISSVGTQSATVTDVSGMLTSTMQTDSFAWVLNTTNGTETNSGVWSRDSVGYPIFTNSLHHPIYRVIFKIGDSILDTNYSNGKGFVDIPDYGAAIWLDSLGNELTATSVVTGDITVYAYYAVSFLNYNGASLNLDTLAYGTVPSYAASVVVRDSTAQYAYSFKGWNPSVKAVNDSATYTAVFDSTILSYEVLFVNYDGDTLSIDTLAYGKYPSYGDSTEVRDSTVQYAYAFKGWSPAVDTVKKASVYTAIFDSTLRSYSVEFVNYDGEVLQSGILDYGSSVSYEGQEPTKPNSAKYSYSFKTWTPSVAEIAVGIATYTAVFDSSVREFSISFVDYAGEVLQNAILSYGASVSYQGLIPTKPSSSAYAYTFKTWNPKITAAVADVAYSPVFDSSKVFSVTIDNGTTQTDTVASILFVLPDAPTKDGYEFIGWYNGDEKLGDAGDTIKVTKDIEISAKLEESSAIASPVVALRFSLAVSGRSLQISNAKVGTNFAVFDMQGRVIRRSVVNSSSFTMDLQNAGVYLVRIGNASQRISIK